MCQDSIRHLGYQFGSKSKTLAPSQLIWYCCSYVYSARAEACASPFNTTLLCSFTLHAKERPDCPMHAVTSSCPSRNTLVSSCERMCGMVVTVVIHSQCTTCMFTYGIVKVIAFICHHWRIFLEFFHDVNYPLQLRFTLRMTPGST